MISSFSSYQPFDVVAVAVAAVAAVVPVRLVMPASTVRCIVLVISAAAAAAWDVSASTFAMSVNFFGRYGTFSMSVSVSETDDGTSKKAVK